jgi:mycothiol synthase
MLTTRPYQHPQDFAKLAIFLSHARSAIHHAHYLHVGDLTWQLFHMFASYRPADLVQIWQDRSEHLLGFVLLYPTLGFFDLQLDPHHRGGSLEAEMFEWVEQHLRPAAEVHTLVNNQDTARLSLLSQHGYQPNGEWFYVQRLLNDALPHMDLPSGFVVRSLAGDHEAAARAKVLGAAFGAPPQPERYQQFMHAPGYIRDLDIVAVAPDHRFAAFAMCWVDRVTKVGQFEPVGTAPDFRRQGLAQAVLYEGLRRMQQYGAERVIVIVEAAEAAACELYAAVGFEYQWSLTLYTKSSAMGQTAI